MNQVTVELPEKGLAQAKTFLRELQARHPTIDGEIRAGRGEGTRDAALARLGEYRKFRPTRHPGVVMRDGLKFDRTLEERRITLAEELVQRVDPGPFEDPVYLAMLAYEAASIQMAVPNSASGSATDPRWSRFLLGTVHSSLVNAFARKFDSHGYVVVVLHSALIEFAYQAAKAVVAAQSPQWSDRTDSLVSVDSSAEQVAAQLNQNQAPAERLYRTLEACFYRGYPRAFHSERVPPEQVLPLHFLIGMAERWIIGHEFGHGLAERIEWDRLLASNRPRAEEAVADVTATLLTAVSAENLDRAPREFGLIGGMFALVCLEVFQRALSIVRDGRETSSLEDAAHPPPKERAEGIYQAFDQFIRTEAPDDPNAALRRQLFERGPTRIDPQTQRRRVFQYPNALLAIWKEVRPRLLQDFQTGRAIDLSWV